jgi:hypothetical protein
VVNGWSSMGGQTAPIGGGSTLQVPPTASSKYSPIELKHANPEPSVIVDIGSPPSIRALTSAPTTGAPSWSVTFTRMMTGSIPAFLCAWKETLYRHAGTGVSVGVGASTLGLVG